MMLKRFIEHYDLVKLIRGDRNNYNKRYRTFSYRLVSILCWLFLVPVNVLDLLGFFKLFDWLRGRLFSTRPLSQIEEKEIRRVFGAACDWKKVRIRENSWMAKLGAKSAKKRHIGFVLFRTVNFSRTLDHENKSTDMPWLIHEITHVLQYNELGAQYIVEALRAQQNAGYAYDGQKGLATANSLSAFNLEQQADIAKDYYRRLRSNKDVSLFDPYMNQIRSGKF